MRLHSHILLGLSNAQLRVVGSVLSQGDGARMHSVSQPMDNPRTVVVKPMSALNSSSMS